MKLFEAITVFSAIVTSSLVYAADGPEVVEYDYRAECTTKATGGDGARSGCDSAWSTHKVPSGYAYVEDKLEKGFTSKNGSEKRCDHAWTDEVEIVKGTGITQPTTLKVRAHARSPRGHFAGRGWAKCYFKGVYVKYK